MDEREQETIENRNLTRMLILIADRARADFAAAVAPFDLAPTLARSLLWLGEPTSMRGIANHLACDPSYVTGLADQLEQRGLVSRVSGKDRRVKLLQLTDEGEELRISVSRAVQTRVGFARQLTPRQRQTLGELLALLLEDTGPQEE